MQKQIDTLINELNCDYININEQSHQVAVTYIVDLDKDYSLIDPLNIQKINTHIGKIVSKDAIYKLEQELNRLKNEQEELKKYKIFYDLYKNLNLKN